MPTICKQCSKAIDDSSSCTYLKSVYHAECCPICKPPPAPPAPPKQPTPPPPPKPKAPEVKHMKHCPGRLNAGIFGSFERVAESPCQTCKKAITGQKFLTRKVGQFNCYNCHAKFVEKCITCDKLFGIEEEVFQDAENHKYCEKCMKLYRESHKEQQLLKAAASLQLNNDDEEKQASEKKKQEQQKKQPVFDKIHCDACTKTISSLIIDFEGANFHDECFACHTCAAPLRHEKFYKESGDALFCDKCKRVLKCVQCAKAFDSGESYYTGGGDDDDGDEAAYCRDCYQNVFGKTCTQCSLRIEAGSTYARFQSDNFHLACFCCSKCTKPIASVGGSDKPVVYLHTDGTKYCEKCVQSDPSMKIKQISTTTTTTTPTAPGTVTRWTAVITIETSVATCCHECKRRFDDGESFYKGPGDGEKYCVACYTRLNGKQCVACAQLIGPSEASVSLEDAYYHKHCIKCSKCATVLLATDTFYKLGVGKYACEKCIRS